jgi:hypothetical protein
MEWEVLIRWRYLISIYERDAARLFDMASSKTSCTGFPIIASDLQGNGGNQRACFLALSQPVQCDVSLIRIARGTA